MVQCLRAHDLAGLMAGRVRQACVPAGSRLQSGESRMVPCDIFKVFVLLKTYDYGEILVGGGARLAVEEKEKYGTARGGKYG